jgi:hypothetical protein
MSNLIKSTSVYIPKEVSNKSRSVYQANTSVMIKNVEDKNIVVNSIHQAVNRSIADKGVNMDIEDMNYLKRSVTDDILKDFPTLTLQDINLCFSMGVRGGLGEYFGLNVVSFYGWLKKYKEEVIPEAMNEVKLYLPPTNIEEPKIEFKKLDFEKVDNICNAIISFKENNSYDFNDFGNIHFNLLNKFGCFDDVSEDEKSTIREDAKQFYLNEMKQKNIDLLAQGKSLQMIDINKLLEKIECGEKDIESMIEIMFKKLSLKRFIINFSPTEKKLEKFKSKLITKIEESYEK